MKSTSIMDTAGLRISTKQIMDFSAFNGSNALKTSSVVEVHNSCKQHLPILEVFNEPAISLEDTFSLPSPI
jgi:hypothetical protein